MLFFAVSYIHINFIILMEAAVYYYFIYILFIYGHRLDSYISDLAFAVVELCYILKRLALCKLDSAFGRKDGKPVHRFINCHQLCPFNDPLACLKVGILPDGVYLP